MNDRPNTSLDEAYFERIYATETDPWNFATSAYERDKYAATLAALPRQRYERGFEIGCSVGVLTEMLAQRVDQLLAVDLNERALAAARARNADAAHLRFERLNFPKDQAAGTFDLLVVSEVAYYWAGEDFTRALDWLVEHLQLGGHIILVHYTPTETDYPLTGDEVHDRMAARFGVPGSPLMSITSYRAPCYRLDVYERVDGVRP